MYLQSTLELPEGLGGAVDAVPPTVAICPEGGLDIFQVASAEDAPAEAAATGMAAVVFIGF